MEYVCKWKPIIMTRKLFSLFACLPFSISPLLSVSFALPNRQQLTAGSSVQFNGQFFRSLQYTITHSIIFFWLNVEFFVYVCFSSCRRRWSLLLWIRLVVGRGMWNSAFFLCIHFSMAQNTMKTKRDDIRHFVTLSIGWFKFTFFFVWNMHFSIYLSTLGKRWIHV